MLRMAIFALVFTLGGYSSNALRSDAMARAIETQSFKDVFYAPPPEWLPVMSLGHREALADVMWIKGLIYFGEALGAKSATAHVYGYVDSILALDPQFARVYRWASTAGIYKPKVELDDLRRAASYSERGAKQFPDNGQMAWDAGSTIMFELLPKLSDETERKELKARAVRYLETAARRNAGPPWLALANLKHLQALGETERAVHHLQEIYLSSDDPELKKQLEARIADLKGREFTRALQLELQQLRERHASRYPYLPALLFEVVAN